MWTTGVVLLALCCVANAHFFGYGFGACPDNMETQQDFDKDMFMGRWFMIMKTRSIFTPNVKCTTEFFTSTGVDTFDFNNTALYTAERRRWRQAEEEVRTIMGEATLDEDDPATIHIRYGDEEEEAQSYQILDTDYTNYTITYSCTEYPSLFGRFIFHRNNLYISGRHPEMSDDLKEAIRDGIKEEDEDLAMLLHDVDQSCWMMDGDSGEM